MGKTGRMPKGGRRPSGLLLLLYVLLVVCHASQEGAADEGPISLFNGMVQSHGDHAAVVQRPASIGESQDAGGIMDQFLAHSQRLIAAAQAKKKAVLAKEAADIKAAAEKNEAAERAANEREEKAAMEAGER